MFRETLFSSTIAGLIYVILNIFIYLFDPLLLANWWLGLSFIPLLLLGLIIIGVRIRTANNGFLPFGQAFMHLFISGMLIGLISTIWTIILHNFVDPGLADALMEETFERMMTMMEGFGAPVDQVEAQFEEALANIENQYAPASLFKGWVYSAFGWAVGALLTSLIVKRKPPVEIDTLDA